MLFKVEMTVLLQIKVQCEEYKPAAIVLIVNEKTMDMAVN